MQRQGAERRRALEAVNHAGLNAAADAVGGIVVNVVELEDGSGSGGVGAHRGAGDGLEPGLAARSGLACRFVRRGEPEGVGGGEEPIRRGGGEEVGGGPDVAEGVA